MKKITFVLGISITISTLILSCNKFIDVPYDNRKELITVDDYDLVLANAYPERADMFTEILTDNLHHYASTMQSTNGPVYVPIFLYDDNYSDNLRVATPTYAYSHYYAKIYQANLVIEGLKDAKDNSSKHNTVFAEALALRAYSYFNLVNLFSLHYNEATNNQNLGVPLLLEVPKENRSLYNRATVSEVYNQIDQDLAEAIRLFNENKEALPRTPYRFSLASIYAFASRLNLYKGNWDEAERFANLVINEKGVIVRKLSDDINRKKNTKEEFFASEIMNPSIHPNLLLTQQSSSYLTRPFGYFLGGFYVDNNFYETVPKNDLRFELFKSSGTVIDSLNLIVKYAHQPNNPNAEQARYDLFTMEEVLLNRAEAALKKANPNINQAMQDIESIRKERFTTHTALAIPTTVEEALEIVYRERRLELLGQGLRWYDIKRLGIRVEHRVNRTSATPDVVLEPNDLRTALQIPLPARIGNPLLEKQLNPR